MVKVVYRGHCGLWFQAFFKHRELGKSVVVECDCSCMCSPRIKRTNVSYVESWAGEAYVEMRGSREVGSAPAGEGPLGLMPLSPLPSSSFPPPLAWTENRMGSYVISWKPNLEVTHGPEEPPRGGSSLGSHRNVGFQGWPACFSS